MARPKFASITQQSRNATSTLKGKHGGAAGCNSSEMRVCVKCHRSCRMDTTPDSDTQRLAQVNNADLINDENGTGVLRESRKRFASQEHLDE